MSNQLLLFTGAPSYHQRQLLALTKAAKKYPKAKQLIIKIKDNKRRSYWLAQ